MSTILSLAGVCVFFPGRMRLFKGLTTVLVTKAYPGPSDKTFPKEIIFSPKSGPDFYKIRIIVIF